MRDLRLCFVGDSFVNGTGDPEMLGWTGRVCRSARAAGIAVTQYNLGVRRDASAQIARRLAAEVSARLEEAPGDRRVVLSFGVNDATHEHGLPRVAPEQTLAHARAMLGWCRARYPTLLIGPPPMASDAAHDARAAALSPALAKVAAALDVPFLDWHAELAADATWRAEALAGDGAHPGAGGYARAAAIVEAWPAWRDWLRGG